MEQKHYTALSVWITPGWLWFLCLHLSWWGPELSQCLPQRNPGTSVLLSWWKNTNIVGLPGTMGPTPSLVRALRDPTATQRSQGAQGKERCILGFGVRFGWRFFWVISSQALRGDGGLRAACYPFVTCMLGSHLARKGGPHMHSFSS